MRRTILLLMLLLTIGLAASQTLLVEPETVLTGEGAEIFLVNETKINATTTLLEVQTPSARYRMLDTDGIIMLPVVYVPAEAGAHVIQLLDRTLRTVLTETTLIVDQAPDVPPEETEEPTEEEPTEVPEITDTPEGPTTGIRLRGKLIPQQTVLRVREGESFSEIQQEALQTLSGVFDVEMEFSGSRTKMMRLQNCSLPQNATIGLEEVHKPQMINGKESTSTYAIDPAEVAFTEGTLTRQAVGQQLWKCVDWEFESQTCLGEWAFVQDIQPGQDYTVRFDATDPGFGETNLTILNVKSYPAVGGNWTVEFNTTGTANLSIRAIEGTKWSDLFETEDLLFLKLTCGGQIVPYTWEAGVLSVEDYSCNATGKETSKVLTKGRHVLEFTFGDITKKAENYASATGILMLRDDTGGQSTNSQTVGNNITWPQQDRVDPAFSHEAGQANITIQTTGLYRISYGVAVRQTGGGRIEDTSRIYVNGNLSTACWAQSYTRGGTSTQDGAMTSDCMMELTSGDQIWLNSLRTSDTTTAESTVADRTWFHMQLLDNPDVLIVRDGAGGQDMDQTAGTIMNWDTIDRQDSIYNFTAGESNVTILESGLYRVTFGLSSQHASDTRYTSLGQVLVNGSQVPVSIGNDFARGANDVRESYLVSDSLIELGAGTTLQIRGGRSSAVSASTTTIANRTWFQIERVPNDDANVVMVYEAGGGESLDDTGGVDIAWDTTQRNDSFFNVTDTNTIEVLQSGFYRVAYSVYNTRPVGATDGTRIELLGNLRIAGADADVCWSSGYNRGDEGGGGDAYDGGQFASCIVNLTAGEDLEIRMRRSSSSSAVITNEGNRTWWYIQALDAINSAPFVNLTWPANGTITNISTIDFNFTAIDNDTTSFTCALYANFTGSFIENVTKTATNATEENFTISPPDGAYFWNVQCTDENGVPDWGDRNWTITIDTTHPSNFNETNTSTTDTSTVIDWDTDEEANSTVEYGNTTDLGTFQRDASYVKAHGLAITGLTASTLYYYNVTSCDRAGNCNTTGPFNFTTSNLPDTSPPVITDVIATPFETTAQINWTTNEVANSTVSYNTTIDLGIIEESATFVSNHSLDLSGLTALTLYYFNVTSCDASGNCNTTGPHNFTTLDLTAPTVTLVAPANTGTTGLTTNLTFNVTDNVVGNMSNCTLYLNSTGNWTANATIYNVTQNANHSFERSFAPGVYLWNVMCIDEGGNSAFTTNRTFTAQDQPMDITLVKPLNSQLSSELTVNFTCSVTDDFGLVSISWYTNVTGTWGLNETVNVTGKSNQSSFIKAMPIGKYLWNCRATDEFGQRQFGVINYTVFVDNRSMEVLNVLNGSVVQPGEVLLMLGNVTLSDGSNVTNQPINVTLNQTWLNPQDASEENLTARNVTPEWWDVHYQFRERLNITNSNASSGLPKGYAVNMTFDTANLTTNNQLLANGSDFRIVYWNGTDNVELDRINDTPFNSATTVIRFQIQAEVAASSSDLNYFIYYNYSDAGAPPTDRYQIYTPLQVMRLEDVGATWQTITFNHTYDKPVIIMEVEEPAVPPEEVVSRIANITDTEFLVRAQNPGENAIGNRNLSIFIIESGIYRTEDNARFEAFRIEDQDVVVGTGTSTPTTYDTVSYNQTYPSAPSVVMQVMSYRDDLWVGDHADSIGTTTAGVALEMGQYCQLGGACPNAEGHDAELMGVMVFERTSGTIDGVEYDAALTPTNINGPTDSTGCFYTAFGTTFSNKGLVAADINTRAGGDGGWGNVCDVNTTHVGIHNEEEDESDGERSHGGTETATYVGFGGEGTLLVINDYATEPTIVSGGQELRPARTDEGGNFTYTFNAPIVEGTYQLLVNVTFGFFNAWNFSFFDVDGTPPVPNITALTPNPAEIGVDTVTVNWTVADAHKDIEYLNVTFPNGTHLNQYAGNASLTPVLLTARGGYDIFVYAMDEAGNFNETNTTLVVQDTQPPVVSLNDPDNATWVLTSTTTFNFTPTDFDDVLNCSVYLNSTGSWSPNISNTTPANGVPNFLSVGIPDGDHLWNVQCYDIVENNAFAANNQTFMVDTTPPAVNLELPVNNTLNDTTNNILFFYNTSDARTDISNCSFILDGTITGPVDTSITEGTTQNFTRFVDNGQHNWSITCTDDNGFTNTSLEFSITVNVANETDPPLITLNDPTVDEYVDTNTILFNYTVNDATGIENCSIYLDDVLNLTNTSVTNNADNFFTISGIPEAEHSWYVSCFDNSTFVEGTSSTRNFTVDLTDPVVVLNLPAGNAFVTTTNVTFNFTPTDTNIDTCTLWHNATGWAANETNSTPVSGQPNFFTKPFADGPYIWNVICVDLAARQSFAATNYTVNVDTREPIILNTTADPASPTTFSPSVTYEFNITLDEPFVDTVLLEHNFTGTLANYTVTNITGNIYTYLYDAIPGGFYFYRWFVNDSLGQENETAQFNYTVTQATPDINLTLNGTRGDISITEDQFVNMTARLLAPTSGVVELYLEGVRIDNGTSPVQNLTFFTIPGTYNVTAIFNATVNYTAGSETHFITVNDTVAPNVTLLSPANDSIVGTDDVVLSYNVSDLGTILNCTLYINEAINMTDTGVEVNQINTFDINLPDGNYTWQVLCYDTANVGTSEFWNFTVIDSTLLNVTVNNEPTYEQGEIARINVTTRDRFVNPLAANLTTAVVYTNTTRTTAPWWNASFPYRKEINVTNNEAFDLGEGYSILVVANTTGPNILDNGSDFRVAYWNAGNASVVEIDRFNTTPFNSTTTEIWFKLQQNISGNAADLGYFFYYGNASVVQAPEDPDEVFAFYDTGNGSGWVNHTTTGLTLTVDNSSDRVVLKDFNSDPGGGYRLFNWDVTDYEIIFKTNRINENGGASNRYGVLDGSGDGYGPRYDSFGASSGIIMEERTAYAATETIATSTSVVLNMNEWYIFRMRKNGTDFNFTAFNSSGSYIVSVAATDATHAGAMDRFQILGGNEFWTDDMRVRRYTTNEPTTSVSENEELLVAIAENETDSLNGIAFVPYDTYLQPFGNYSVVSLGTRQAFDNGNGSNFFELGPDVTAPTIQLISPPNVSWRNTTSVNFTYYVDDRNLQNCTLWHNATGWAANVSNTSPTNQENNTLESELPEGPILWNVQCYDTFGNAGFAPNNFTVRVDRTPPSIVLNAPGNDSNESSPVVYNWTPSDAYSTNITCNFSVNGSLVASNLNTTTGVPIVRNENVTFNGVVDWNVSCVDEAGNAGGSEIFVFFHIIAPQNLTARTVTNGQNILLNWSVIPGATSYNVYISTNYSSGRNSNPNITGLTHTNFTDENAADSLQRYYWVSVNRTLTEAINETPVGKYTRYMPLNFSLLSFPLIPHNLTLENGSGTGYEFGLDSSCLTSLWDYNGTAYRRTDWNGTHFTPAGGSELFREVNMTRSYWLETNTSCNVTFAGAVPQNTFTRTLSTGSNFAGWHTVLNTTLPTNFGQIAISVQPNNTVQAINRYDPVNNEFEVTIHFVVGGDPWGWFPSFNDQDFLSLEPTRGYVLDATTTANWTFDPQT